MRGGTRPTPTGRPPAHRAPFSGRRARGAWAGGSVRLTALPRPTHLYTLSPTVSGGSRERAGGGKAANGGGLGLQPRPNLSSLRGGEGRTDCEIKRPSCSDGAPKSNGRPTFPTGGERSFSARGEPAACTKCTGGSVCRPSWATPPIPPYTFYGPMSWLRPPQVLFSPTPHSKSLMLEAGDGQPLPCEPGYGQTISLRTTVLQDNSYPCKSRKRQRDSWKPKRATNQERTRTRTRMNLPPQLPAQDPPQHSRAICEGKRRSVGRWGRELVPPRKWGALSLYSSAQSSQSTQRTLPHTHSRYLVELAEKSRDSNGVHLPTLTLIGYRESKKSNHQSG